MACRSLGWTPKSLTWYEHPRRPGGAHPQAACLTPGPCLAETGRHVNRHGLGRIRSPVYTSSLRRPGKRTSGERTTCQGQEIFGRIDPA